MKFRSKNLLITGGAGFIGSNFVNYFLNKYHRVNVINLDILSYAGTKENMKMFYKNPKHTFVEGDICDYELVMKIFKKYSIDGVINFAAESHVDNSIIYPEKFVRTNINGVLNLLNVANTLWMKSPHNVNEKYKHARFHQISTDEVYGSIKYGSFNENSPYMPNSPYSASKASADLLVRSFNKTFGLNTVISICSNNYGLNQNMEKFIPKVIHCIKNNIEIPVYGNGKNVRDWIYVIDHCKAIDLIYNSSKNGQTYNIGTKQELNNLELVDLICKVIGLKSRIKFVNDRPGHDFRYSINSNKLKKELGWKPHANIEDEIMKFFKN